MHRISSVATIAAGLCLLVLSTDAAAQRRGRRGNGEAVANGWRFDYESARASARKSDKPLMVVFRCVP